MLVFKEMNKRRFFMRMVGEKNQIFWQGYFSYCQFFVFSMTVLRLQNVKSRLWGAESPSSFASIKNPQSGFLCYRAKLALIVIA